MSTRAVFAKAMRPFVNHIIKVPNDHACPNGRMMGLSVDQYGEIQRGQAPVLVLLGGPGEAAESVLKVDQMREMIEVLSRSTVVFVVDQRGCGKSEPHWPKVPVPRSQDFFASEENAAAALVQQAVLQREQMPEWFSASQISPLQSAHDLRCLAGHFDFQKVALLGYSYGTHLAMAAMKVAPSLFERIVLCGCEGPDQTFKLPAQFQEQISKLSSIFGRKIDEDVKNATQAVGEHHTFGLHWILATWLGVRPRLARVPRLLQSIINGDTTQFQKATEGFMKMLDNRPPTFWLCDSASGATLARAEQIKADATKCPIGTASNACVRQVGAAWGQCDLGDAYRQPVEAPCPTLVLTGSMDPFTPSENVATAFKNASEIHQKVIKNATHTDLLTGHAVQKCVARFLLEGKIEPGELEVPPIDWE